MKKISLAITIISLCLFFLGCTTSSSPNLTNENEIIEQAYEYCSQFTEENCSNAAYLPAGTQEAIKCFWNNYTSECFAGLVTDNL